MRLVIPDPSEALVSRFASGARFCQSWFVRRLAQSWPLLTDQPLHRNAAADVDQSEISVLNNWIGRTQPTFLKMKLLMLAS